MIHPKARQDDLVVQELFDEMVVYDQARDEVHSLNPTAAQVWQGCDGQTSPAQLAGRLPPELAPAQAKELVWLALDRLEKARLLEQKVTRPGGLKISRRRALRALGISALLLPVVASIPAPVAAQTLSCIGTPTDVLDPGLVGVVCADAGSFALLNTFCEGQCSGGYATFCDDTGSDIDKVICCCP